SEEADERQGREGREHCEIERLLFEVRRPTRYRFVLIGEIPRLSRRLLREDERQQNGGGQLHLPAPDGVSRARATRRAPFRMAREELLMEIDARETAATSAPTLNGSRMSLPLNCRANSGSSTEK